MVVNHQIQKTRLQADRKFHDSIVRDIFEDPVCLNIEGLDSDSIIWKVTEYHYMHGPGHMEEGRYELFPGPDLVFFYLNADGFHLLVLEVKGSILGKSHIEAKHQLNRVKSYFTVFWKAVIINEIKPALLSRVRESIYVDVFLSLAETTRELLIPEYIVIPYKTNIRLGKLAISRSANRVQFVECFDTSKESNNSNIRTKTVPSEDELKLIKRGQR
jgi:hypothetical protein